MQRKVFLDIKEVSESVTQGYHQMSRVDENVTQNKVCTDNTHLVDWQEAVSNKETEEADKNDWNCIEVETRNTLHNQTQSPKL